MRRGAVKYCSAVHLSGKRRYSVLISDSYPLAERIMATNSGEFSLLSTQSSNTEILVAHGGGVLASAEELDLGSSLSYQTYQRYSHQKRLLISSLLKGLCLPYG